MTGGVHPSMGHLYHTPSPEGGGGYGSGIKLGGVDVGGVTERSGK